MFERILEITDGRTAVISSIAYCTVTFMLPEPLLLVAVIVALPATPKVASPFVIVEKLTTVVLLLLQVTLLVTFVPFWVAVNC